MKKILIEGGIGVGKSYVCKLFSELGIPIFYSDIEAKKIVDYNTDVINMIKNEFGDDIYKDGILDRKSLADIVFNDNNKLKLLDSIVHPVVQKKFELWCKTQEEIFKDSPYVIEESAIAIKNGIHKDFDKIIVVTADESTRISRVMLRDNCTEDKVMDRIKSQISESDRIKLADFVIINDSFPNAKCQVDFIHKILLKN